MDLFSMRIHSMKDQNHQRSALSAAYLQRNL